MTRILRPYNHHALALLLLVLALLVFAARGAGHGHDTPPQPGDTLCAVCVYGGGTLGGAGVASSVPVVPLWQARPEAPAWRTAVAPAPAHARIRGPPVSA